MATTFRAAKGEGVKGAKSWGVIRDTVNMADWYLNPCFSRADATDTAKRENDRTAMITRYGTDDIMEIAKMMARA